MASDNFKTNCIIRTMFISINLYLFFFILFNHNFIFTTIIIGILPGFQLFSLFKYIEKQNMTLVRFLESINFSDLSGKYKDKLPGKEFKNVYNSYKKIMSEFKQTRFEKEEHSRYLQTIVQHIGIGLIAFNQEGKIDLVNRAAKKILKISNLKHINQINIKNDIFAKKLFDLSPGEKTLIKIKIDEETQELSINTTDFILNKKKYKLVSIQNIQKELEEKELEAWQRLIRVLTHEIMNSITPISSLASTANSIMNKYQKETKNTSEYLKDIHNAINVIEKRSIGLINFVNNYRKLTRLPNPNIKPILISELFYRIISLLKNKFHEKNIKITKSIEPKYLILTADPDLIEQVMINLLNNSINALSRSIQAYIEIEACIDASGHCVISITDNGSGIEKEVLDKVFIPFFTTRSDGSGIGLNLSRQIMWLHKGSIHVYSEPNKITTFTLRF